jgi:hypothetical protein
VVESQKNCIALLFVRIDSEESNLTLVVIQRGLRLRKNLVLCGLLNGDICIFVVLKFSNKSRALYCFTFEVHILTLA